MNTFRRLATVGATLAVAATAVTAAGAAPAARTAVSSNWAGYVASSVDPQTGGAGTFSSVSGTWVQPAARCTSAGVTGPTSSAFWVGLGGNSQSSNALEQIGTEADCTAAGVARYSAWYELVPATSVKIHLDVAAGDTISASVAVTGTKVTVRMKNLTRGESFSKTLHMAAPDTTSADWVAEAPSLCATSYRCRQQALTNFGTVKFSHATATSSGHTGSISDPAWTATAVELDGLGARSFGRFADQMTAARAVPSSLGGNGSTFSVTWHSGSSSQAGSGYPGYGYGGGYPGYGGGYPGYGGSFG